MVTERRPHWDDDLIKAVARAASGYDEPPGTAFTERIYNVIAAVEDWQRQRGPSLTEFIEMDEAIKRVRDVTVPVPGDVYDLDSYTRGAADALALTNKALDGGSSTVLPPLPSTPLDQNPVCPACGGTLALERNRVVCLSDEVNHYWYWDGSDD